MSASSLLRAAVPSLPERVAGASAILMLTSWSEVLTPAELSMKSVLMRPPRCSELDAGALRHAEVGAFADHFRAHLGSRDAQGIVGAVADIGVRLGRGAQVGADAAEPEQIGLAFQDGADQLVGASGWSASTPSSALISSLSAIDLAPRENTPPPVEILDLS